MTVSNTNTKDKFITNGVTTVFPFTFYLTTVNQVKAKTIDSNGVETEYTNFTVTINPDGNGGSFTTGDVLNNVDLLVFRQTPQTQETDYVEGGRFPADAHEDALDKLTQQNQEQQEELDRTLKTSIGSDNNYQLSNNLVEDELLYTKSNVISSTGTTLEDLNKAIENARLLGYLPPIPYVGGIVFDNGDNQKTIERNGIIYAPLPSQIPFTTSGTWTGDDENKFFVVQGITTSSLPTYTDLVFDSVADMVAGNPVTPSLGDTCSTGYTVWKCLSDNPASIGDFEALNDLSVKDFGATGDGVTDDTSSIQETLSQGGNIVFPLGTYFVSSLSGSFTFLADTVISGYGATITTDIDNTTTPNRKLFNVTTENVTIRGLEFDCSQSSSLQSCITATETAHNITIEDVTIRNLYSDTYVFAIAINAGINNYRLNSLEFYNITVLPDGQEGNLNGTNRAIYVGYVNVGTDPGSNLGGGSISNIYAEDMGPYEDTDMIHCISNSGVQPYTHYSQISINNVRGKNIAKRLVKCQINGVTVNNVYADATNITYDQEYMFAIVAALNGSTSVSNVRGKGKFKTGIECKDESFIDIVYVESDYQEGEELSGIHPLILNEGGKDGRGALILSNIRTRGTWRSLLQCRYTGYGNTTKVVVNGLFSDNSTADYAIGISAADQTAELQYVKIMNAVIGTRSNLDPVLFTTSRNGDGTERIRALELNNITVLGNSTSSVGVDLRAEHISVNDLEDYSNVNFVIQTVAVNSVMVKNIKDASGTTGGKSLGNFASSSNVLAQGCYSPTATASTFRVDGGDQFLFTNNVAAAGQAHVNAVNSPTRLQQIDNYNLL